MRGEDVRTRTVLSDGVRLHVREWPGGPYGVLLIHGLASSSHIWDLVAPRLSRSGLRAVAYDQRGHGLSEKLSAGYGFDHTVADAAAVIRATGLRRPVVVGHSWGANVALEVAVRRPRLVTGAVLLDGGFLPLHERFDWKTAKEALAPPEFAGMPVDQFLARVRTDLGRLLKMTPEIEAVILSLVRVDQRGTVLPRLSRRNHLKILRALWEQNPIELLRRVRVPTLVLAVRSPRSVPDQSGFMEAKERAARTVRSIGEPVRFEWIEGIHDLPLQRPEALARRIIRFSRSVGNVRPGRS